MTTNKRTASSLMNDDRETKKSKSEDNSTASISTTSKEPIPTFINENITNKTMCEYGEACYRQKNPIHTSQYDHPRNLFSFRKIHEMSHISTMNCFFPRNRLFHRFWISYSSIVCLLSYDRHFNVKFEVLSCSIE